METFVDPSRFIGTIYRAANWNLVGKTKGYKRIRNGYSNICQSSKLVFVLPLQRNARLVLSRSLLPQQYVSGAPRMKLTADQMRSLPVFFKQINDPRRAQGRQHSVHVVLAIAAAAVLCGMRGYKAISDWTKALSPTARVRFGCYFSHRKTASRAKVPYVMSLFELTTSNWTRPSRPGMPNTVSSTKAWQSTAKPCAMPLTMTADRFISWVREDIKANKVTPKKCRQFASKRKR